MNDNSQIGSKTTSSWDTYWQGAQYSHAFSDSGVSHPAIRSFWESFFRLVAAKYKLPKVIDIASGNGALLELALEVMGEAEGDISCADISPAAIENIQQRFPSVTGHICDARSIPLASHTFDVVTSQFGVEYAGTAAIDEAVRLLAPGGRLTFLMHRQDGGIHQECENNLAVIERIQASGFISNAIDMFRTGFEAMRGADRKPYETAANRLAESMPEIENIIRESSERAAGTTALRLYNDVADIHSRLQHYDPDEVLDWLQRSEMELEAYAERMRSMLASALDGTAMENICDQIESSGLVLDVAEGLFGQEKKLPLAWAISAHKP